MVLLKEVVATIIEERLLDNVKRVGAKLLTGLYELQVRSSLVVDLLLRVSLVCCTLPE